MLEMHLNEDLDLASRKKEFIERSVAWMVKHFKIDDNFKLCDFGCGPGLYTTKLAQHGAAVTGIDFSETSINYAKKIALENKLEIEYFLQNYLDFTTDKKFNLICLIYCDFCALNPQQRKNLLKKFYDFLDEQGSLLLDVSSLHHYNSTKEQSTFEHSANSSFGSGFCSFGSDFWSTDPHYIFHNTFKYDNQQLTLDKFISIEEKRVRENYNWLQNYSIQSITKELAENGFDVVEHYSNVAGDAYKDEATEIAIVAKKTFA